MRRVNHFIVVGYSTTFDLLGASHTNVETYRYDSADCASHKYSDMVDSGRFYKIVYKRYLD